MIKNNRRECIMYDQCILFTIFEKTNHRIIEKSSKATQFICNEGIKALKNIAKEYLKNKNKSQSSDISFQNYQKFDYQDKLIILKKQLISEPSESSLSETKKYPSFHMKSEAKFRDNSFIPNKKRLSQAEELRQSLRKLHIQQKEFSNQQDNQENIDNFNFDNLKHKSLEQLLSQTNTKNQEKKALTGKKQNQSESSESSYSLTDYSSNQSSNQNEYDEQLRLENSFPQNLPIRSSHPSFSQSSIGSAGYLPSKICQSPIKSKSNKKRTYIRNKKIPKWAEDMQRVKQETYKQRKNTQLFDYRKTYGVCYVQKLDSNIIFNIETDYRRGSSAKWNRYPYNQFIQ